MPTKKEYIEPVPSALAIPEINEFRMNLPNRGQGVWYYKEDILEYLNKDFPKFVNDHPLNPPYEWVVGHYFKIHKGRLCFFVIPTKLNKETNEVEDRISGKIHPSIPSEYAEATKGITNEKKKDDPIGDDEAFDKGDMWP